MVDRIRPRAKKNGRPSAYKPEYDRLARKFCLLGATEIDLAGLFDTTVQTINSWKKNYPSFLESIKEGKAVADATVAEKLYHRACGYSHPDEKILVINEEVVRVKSTKHYPPDTGAAVFWLKNRRPDLWRDRHEVTGKDGKDLFDLSKLTDNELSAIERLVEKSTAVTGTDPGRKGPTIN